jgi:hypothetical protein
LLRDIKDEPSRQLLGQGMRRDAVRPGKDERFYELPNFLQTDFFTHQKRKRATFHLTEDDP